MWVKKFFHGISIPPHATVSSEPCGLRSVLSSNLEILALLVSSEPCGLRSGTQALVEMKKNKVSSEPCGLRRQGAE